MNIGSLPCTIIFTSAELMNLLGIFIYVHICNPSSGILYASLIINNKMKKILLFSHFALHVACSVIVLDKVYIKELNFVLNAIKS